MTLSAWLRFVELSLLAGWAAWRLYRPRPLRRGEAVLPGLAAALSLAQVMVEAQSASDPFTSLAQILPVVLGSAYGALSLVVAVLGLGAAVWIWRKPAASAAAASALTLVVCGAIASAGAADAVSAATSSGEIAMSPTLAVPRAALTTPNPYAGDPASAERGRAVYQQYCVACHGLNGDGNGPAIAGLRIRPPNFHNPQHYLAPGMDGAHFWVIQHGDGQTGGMPAWQGTLTDHQIWDVLNYVKQIAASGPTASSGSFPPDGSATRQ
ncbi:MAG TPA: cytochrome c [Chloroflexota bacterium]